MRMPRAFTQTVPDNVTRIIGKGTLCHELRCVSVSVNTLGPIFNLLVQTEKRLTD